jgi:septal ring factor EnvC (AmiA/AmiB activator)
MASPAIDRSDDAGRYGKPVGGRLMTNFGDIDQGTTIGAVPSPTRQ